MTLLISGNFAGAAIGAPFFLPGACGFSVAERPFSCWHSSCFTAVTGGLSPCEGGAVKEGKLSSLDDSGLAVGSRPFLFRAPTDPRMERNKRLTRVVPGFATDEREVPSTGFRGLLIVRVK
jgi:hypothetical protein